MRNRRGYGPTYPRGKLSAKQRINATHVQLKTSSHANLYIDQPNRPHDPTGSTQRRCSCRGEDGPTCRVLHRSLDPARWGLAARSSTVPTRHFCGAGNFGTRTRRGEGSVRRSHNGPFGRGAHDPHPAKYRNRCVTYGSFGPGRTERSDRSSTKCAWNVGSGTKCPHSSHCRKSATSRAGVDRAL